MVACGGLGAASSPRRLDRREQARGTAAGSRRAAPCAMRAGASAARPGQSPASSRSPASQRLERRAAPRTPRRGCGPWRVPLDQRRRRLAEGAGVDLLRQRFDPAARRRAGPRSRSGCRRSASAARPARPRARARAAREATPPAAGSRWCRAARSFPPPCSAARPILQDDALGLELVADAVGRRRSRGSSWPRRARRCALSIAAAVAARPGTTRPRSATAEQARAAARCALSVAGILERRQAATARAGVLRSSRQRLEHAARRPRPARHRRPRDRAGRASPSTARPGSRSTAAAGGNARDSSASRSVSPLVPLRQQLRRRDDVAERLRHLLRAHVDEAVVHPVARERRAAVGAAALRDLVLVVREDEVEPAAVDVDRLAQMRARSSPSIRCASPAGRGPTGESQPITPSRARLPQHEVGRIALVGRDLDPRAGDHRVAVAAG